MVERQRIPNVPTAPNGEIFAEACLGACNAVREKRLTPEKANELTEEAYRNSMIAQASGIPVEIGSTQLRALIASEERGKLKNRLQKNSQLLHRHR